MSPSSSPSRLLFFVCLLVAIAGGAVGLVRSARGPRRTRARRWSPGACARRTSCARDRPRLRASRSRSRPSSTWRGRPARPACPTPRPKTTSTPGPVQPIQFSHKHHAGLYQIDCQYCHSGTDRSPAAGVPSVALCMGCHQQFPPSYDELEGIRTLKEHWKQQTPVEWVQIHRLPEYVQFQHVAHVRRGIACQELPREGRGDGQGPSHTRHEMVAVAAADAEARDGLVHPVSSGERRVARLRHLPLLGSGRPWPSSIVVIS